MASEPRWLGQLLALALVLALSLGAGCADFARGDDPPEPEAAEAESEPSGEPGSEPEGEPADAASGEPGAPVDTIDDSAEPGGEAEPEVVEPEPPGFADDLLPVLLDECGACHKGGGGDLFFTKEADVDYDTVVSFVNEEDPEASDLLTKATAEVDHGGNDIIDSDSETYKLILAWIEGGLAP